VLTTIPVLHQPRLTKIRNDNPPEFMMRLITLIYLHQRPQHHAPPEKPGDAGSGTKETQPRSAAAVGRADSHLATAFQHSQPATAGGGGGSNDGSAADKRPQGAPVFGGGPSGHPGSAHQRQGEAAPLDESEVHSRFPPRPACMPVHTGTLPGAAVRAMRP
jgi:hypothetical protein